MSAGKCPKCDGKGTVSMGGMVLNGRFIGKRGTCYSCGGKGVQDAADVARCAAYWRLNVARLAGMA